MSLAEKASFMFCDYCGTMWDYKNPEYVQCPLCKFKKSAEEVKGKEITYTVSYHELRRGWPLPERKHYSDEAVAAVWNYLIGLIKKRRTFKRRCSRIMKKLKGFIICRRLRLPKWLYRYMLRPALLCKSGDMARLRRRLSRFSRWKRNSNSKDLPDKIRSTFQEYIGMNGVYEKLQISGRATLLIPPDFPKYIRDALSQLAVEEDPGISVEIRQGNLVSSESPPAPPPPPASPSTIPKPDHWRYNNH